MLGEQLNLNDAFEKAGPRPEKKDPDKALEEKIARWKKNLDEKIKEGEVAPRSEADEEYWQKVFPKTKDGEEKSGAQEKTDIFSGSQSIKSTLPRIKRPSWPDVKSRQYKDQD